MEDRPGMILVPAWIVGLVAAVLVVWIFGLLGLVGAPLLLIGIGLQARSRWLVRAGIALGVLLVIAVMMLMPFGGVEGGISDVSTE